MAVLPDPVDRFRHEYPAALERLVARYANVQAEADLKVQNPPTSGRGSGVSHFWLKRSDGHLVWESRPQTKDPARAGRRVAYCDDGAEGPFVMAREKAASRFKINEMGEAARRVNAEGPERFVISPFLAFRIDMRELLAAPLLKIEAARSIPDPVEPGTALIEVRMRVGGNAHRIVFDPARDWAIREGSFAFAPNVAWLDYSVDYDSRSSDRFRIVQVRRHELLGTDLTCKFERFEFRDTRPEEFRLTRYIPEGGQVPAELAPPAESGWPTWGWATLAVVAGFGFTGLAWIARSRFRSRH